MFCKVKREDGRNDGARFIIDCGGVGISMGLGRRRRLRLAPGWTSPLRTVAKVGWDYRGIS